MEIKPWKSLLIVEDDRPLGHMLIQWLIRHFGKSPALRQVTSLAEAIADLQAHPADIVVLDLFLPDSSDFSAVATISALISNRPVICMSGIAKHSHKWANPRIEALLHGAQAYVSKGECDLHKELIRAIEEAWARYSYTQQQERAHERERSTTTGSQ